MHFFFSESYKEYHTRFIFETLLDVTIGINFEQIAYWYLYRTDRH